MRVYDVIKVHLLHGQTQLVDGRSIEVPGVEDDGEEDEDQRVGGGQGEVQEAGDAAVGGAAVPVAKVDNLPV